MENFLCTSSSPWLQVQVTLQLSQLVGQSVSKSWCYDPYDHIIFFKCVKSSQNY